MEGVLPSELSLQQVCPARPPCPHSAAPCALPEPPGGPRALCIHGTLGDVVGSVDVAALGTHPSGQELGEVAEGVS